MKKEKRHRYILDIIKNNNINTQKELSKELKNLGINTTQATISRDIKELNIVKVLNPDGNSQYTVFDTLEASNHNKLEEIFFLSLISISEFKSNILVRTLDKAAGICTDYIGELNIEGIEGYLTSDDSILILIESGYNIEKIINILKEAKYD